MPPRKNPTGLIVGIVALVVVVLAVCTGGTIFAVRSLGNLKSIRSLRTVTVASPTPAPVDAYRYCHASAYSDLSKLPGV